MFKKVIFRVIQFFVKALTSLITWQTDELISKEDALKDLPKNLKQKNINKVFLITDPYIYSIGLCSTLEQSLKEEKLEYILYKDVVSNPTINSIEQALSIYIENKCDAIIAVGGGSVMDSAKLMGARFSNYKKTLKQMRGYFKVQKRIPYLIVVPTTSGSGSEATIVGVVTDESTHEKYAVTSPKLIPNMVVLDPNVTINLPSFVTATTGMDALTHALECYIGKANTKLTKKQSLEAIKKIWVNLEKAVKEPTNLEARRQMQEASFLAGAAFTRGFVGYVHALAHPLSGFYNIPHGLANAVLLPKVLRKYGKSINKDMQRLYKELGYQGLEKEKITSFLIEEIEKLNERIGIPNKLLEIKEEDLLEMTKRSLKEAHPMYPVPRFLSRKELINIYREIM